jgi:hypothetical protein
MSCENKKNNLEFCKCTYSSCSRRGICCQCIQYHLPKSEVPGCFFGPEAEKTYNRSKEYFVSISGGK